jgi:hypothetical protein
MSFTAAIDISTFIWCEQDFKANKNQYIVLRSLMPNLFTQIKDMRLPILFRENLQQLILTKFPFQTIEEKEIGYDFYRLTYEFLIDTFSNWVIFVENTDNTIYSAPVIKKTHFSDNIQEETQSQICHMFHNNQNTEHKFIAYNYFFNSRSNLVLNKGDENVEIDTLRYNCMEEIVAFFEKYKIKFRHNPKHDRYKSGGIVSPLSCYNDRIGDITAAQDLLEKSVQIGDDFFWYDEPNNVYVQFVPSNDGTFHGFDISDEQMNVPSTIKNRFNKNGRKF